MVEKFFFIFAEGGIRTPTSVRTLDPEPSASANSATSAYVEGYYKFGAGECQEKFIPAANGR